MSTQRDKENLFKLIDYKGTNKILQGRENQTPVRNFTSEQKEFVERTIEQVEAIKRLKEELRNEIDENKVLRENLEFIQDKYKEQTQKLSSENSDLKSLAQKLTDDFEGLVLENSELTRQISFAGKKADHNEVKSQDMLKNLETVRELVKVFLSESNTRRVKDIKERNFWQSISSERLIKESEPPTDFPFPDKPMSNEKFIAKSEFDKVSLELKRTQEELKKAQNTIAAAEEENGKVHQKLADLQKEQQEEIEKMAQQHRGLVRRINYLIQEKERVEHECKGRNEYISKLELRLIQQELNNKGLRSRVNSAVKSQGFPAGLLGHNPEQESNTTKKQRSYAQIYTKAKRGVQNNKLKSQERISLHSYFHPNDTKSQNDTEANLNLTNVFRSLKDARAASGKMLQTGREFGSQLSGGNGIYEPIDAIQAEGTQRLNSSLFDEALSNTTNPESRSAIRQMQMKMQSLPEHLEGNKQAFAGLRSNKLGINYAFDDDSETQNIYAMKQGPGSECFEGDDRSANNASFKSH